MGAGKGVPIPQRAQEIAAGVAAMIGTPPDSPA